MDSGQKHSPPETEVHSTLSQPNKSTELEVSEEKYPATDHVSSNDVVLENSRDPEKAVVQHPSDSSLSDLPEVVGEKAEDRDVEANKTSSRASSGSKTAVDTSQPGATIDATDPEIVDWDGPNDPENPLNWSAQKRWGHVAIVSMICFVTPLASSMFAPGVPVLMSEFHSDSSTLSSFVVSVYLIGFAAGPLAIAPLSEYAGRLWVYHACNTLFIAFTVACALSTSLPMLIGFRFLEGCAGSAPLALAGGTIVDVTPITRRGAAMAMFAMGPLIGPVVGPVAGGYLSQASGWRWVFWVIAITAGVIGIGALIFMRETYHPTLLARRAAHLRSLPGASPTLRSKYDKGIPAPQFFLLSVVRAAKLLIFSPIVFLLSLFMAVVYGYLYLLFTTFTPVFEQNYGFSPGNVGLTYLGIGLGNIVGLVICGVYSDRIVKRQAAKAAAKATAAAGPSDNNNNPHASAAAEAAFHETKMKPEMRLPIMILLSPCVPLGLFWYGWSAQAHAHWIVPILGTMLVGVGLLATFMSIQTYMVDAFTIYAASALAANTVLRSLVGGVLPLGGRGLYARLGLGWGNSLLAFVALAMCPIPWVFYRYGERIRGRSNLRL